MYAGLFFVKCAYSIGFPATETAVVGTDVVSTMAAAVVADRDGGGGGWVDGGGAW